ncbi:MAG: pirin family protein [Chlamydiales bacterium]|nr:pirin family protein [Chlamydiales bacterium]
MIQIRTSKERGYEDKGWLQTYHTFSFDTYYDPDFLSYRDLRVINEDRVKGGKGFGTHYHRDVEILTYVLEGALEHHDSMGNTSVIRPGEVLRMSAGRGITHSEYNLSHHMPVHFFQIWINPERHDLEPSYSQRFFSPASKWGQWCLIGSRNGRDGSLRIYQDVDLYSTILDDNDEIVYEALFDRYYWVHIVSGKFMIQESLLDRGDSAALKEESTIQIRCLRGGELLLFDLV